MNSHFPESNQSPVSYSILIYRGTCKTSLNILDCTLYFHNPTTGFPTFFLLGTENILERRFEMKVEVEQRKWSSRLELVRKNRCLYTKTSLFRHLNYFFCVFHR